MSDRNTQLMKAMGSKTGQYDPEPPDQWRWYLKNGAIPHDRVVAWVKSKTIALGHHSAYAVDEHGEALYIENAAADLGWSLQTARNEFSEVNRQGRIRLDPKARRIYLNAEFKTELSHERRTDGEDAYSVRVMIPAYLIDLFESLPKSKKDAAIREYAAFAEWKNKVVSDAVAAARAIVDPIEDTILERHGLEKKRLPKRRPPADGAVQLTLLEVPQFVQTQEAAMYKSENGSVHDEKRQRTNGASLLSSDSDSDREAGGHIVGIENQERGNPETPASPPDPLLNVLIDCGLVQYDPGEIEPVRTALGKTDLRLFAEVVKDRLTRGRFGLPVLIELAKKAARAHARIGRSSSNRMERGEDLSIQEAREIVGDPRSPKDRRSSALKFLAALGEAV